MDESLLDTDIISYFIKGDETIAKQILEYRTRHEKITISLITYFEILKGLAFKDASTQKNRFLAFVKNECQILIPSTKSAELSANIYADLRKSGISIGTADLLIAGIALEHDLTLVSNNTKHYANIPDLKLANWKI